MKEMKKALLVITGVHYSHKLADQAIDWASKHQVSLHAVFLESRREKKEGYGFPSDMALTEQLANESDAERDDKALIEDYQKLLKDSGKERSVDVNCSVLTSPRMKDILDLTKDSSLVFVDANFNRADPLSPSTFTIEKLKKGSSAPVMVVPEE